MHFAVESYGKHYVNRSNILLNCHHSGFLHSDMQICLAGAPPFTVKKSLYIMRQHVTFKPYMTAAMLNVFSVAFWRPFSHVLPTFCIGPAHFYLFYFCLLLVDILHDASSTSFFY